MSPTQIKYAIMAAGLVAWTLAVAWTVSDYKERGYRAAIAEQKADAERKLTAATDRARQKENEDAEKARNIDAIYQAMLNDAYAGRDAFNERVRIARRGACGGNAPASQAAHTGVGSDPPAGGDPGRGQLDPASHLRDAMKELQRYAVAAHAFALACGR